MKTQLAIGFALLLVAAVLFGISAPTLFISDNCEQLSNGFRVCAIATRIGGSPVSEELMLAIYGIPFTIGGIGLVILYRVEK